VTLNDDLMGYVTLWNDVRPIVEAVRDLMPTLEGYSEDIDLADLRSALARYESLYPEHIMTYSAERVAT